MDQGIFDLISLVVVLLILLPSFILYKKRGRGFHAELSAFVDKYIPAIIRRPVRAYMLFAFVMGCIGMVFFVPYLIYSVLDNFIFK